MAQVLGAEMFAPLLELAAPLVGQAYLLTEGRVMIDEGSTEEMIETSRTVQAAIFAFQAVLQSLPLSELGAMAALASVSGTVLAQCTGDQRQTYAGFQTQFARVLREVSLARAMAAAPAEGRA